MYLKPPMTCSRVLMTEDIKREPIQAPATREPQRAVSVMEEDGERASWELNAEWSIRLAQMRVGRNTTATMVTQIGSTRRK